MKLTPLILAIFVSLLTFEPVITEVMFNLSDTCMDCSKGSKSDYEKHKTCNPFKTCGTCFGWINAKTFSAIIKVNIPIDFTAIKRESLISQYYTSLFNPPEILV